MSLPAPDYARIMKRAVGLPPSSYLVLGGLMLFANYRLYCHPSLRTLSQRCGLTTKTCEKAIADLEARSVVLVMRKFKAVNNYQIQHVSKWNLCEKIPQISTPNLWYNLEQKAVVENTTDENAKLHRNCSKKYPLTRTSPQGANGSAVAEESVLDTQAMSEDAITERVAFL